MEGLKFLIEGIRQNRTQFLLLLGFALFPIYTSMADLPFWNDIAMRIMLLGMAAMDSTLCLDMVVWCRLVMRHLLALVPIA